MSDEQRPVRPAAPLEPEPEPKASEELASAEHTPSFTEVDALLHAEKPIGPAPDHASAYVPPRELPKETRHKTIEDLKVRIRQEADSRRAKTQKLPPRPVEPKDTVRLNRPRRPPPPAPSQTSALAWMISVSVIVVAFMVAGVVIYRMRMPDPSPTAAPTQTATAAALVTVTPIVEEPAASAAPAPATASASSRPPVPAALPPSPKPRSGSRK